MRGGRKRYSQGGQRQILQMLRKKQKPREKEQKYPAEQLGTAPVGRLILEMSVPSVIGVMAYSIYNLFDTVFLSQGAGMEAVGGAAVSFPLFLFLSAVSSTLGSGAASVMSRAFGRGDMEQAAKTAGNTFAVFYGTAVLVTVFGLLFLDPVLYAMGVTDDLLPYARDYTRIILAGAVTSTGFSSLIRAEGNSRYAMNIWVIPLSANVVFDCLFIFAFRMGVTGAALGTVLGQCISMGMSIWYFFLSGKSCLNLKLRHFIPDFPVIKEILLTGLPSFVQTCGTGLSTVIVNWFLRKYGGSLSIGTYGIAGRVMTFVQVPVMGLAQGIQPVIGYNRGAGKRERVRETMKKSLRGAAVYGGAVYLLTALFPETVLGIFTGDEEVLKLGSRILRIAGLGLAFSAVVWIRATYFQAVGRKRAALLAGLLGPVIFFAPTAFVLGGMFGLDGIWYAFPVSAAAACLVTKNCTDR